MASPSAPADPGMRAPVPDGVRFVPLTPAEFGRRTDEAMAIYEQAMNYPAPMGRQRAAVARRHVRNDGFAARGAFGPDGQLVGFGYGYTGRPGQWWHDLVRLAIGPELTRAWMSEAFELSELHVLPDWQAHGIGRRLLRELAASIDNPAMLLSTPDADTRASRMYRAMGFEYLRRGYLFPGDSRPFCVMGARLPLPPETGLHPAP